ncbi:MAG: T9SS type A sorting domain-containing protein [Flavobacteriales bacterium]|nr:T9SS type A sorting domain-containing protein [Flavobacteriales bacterium]MDG1766540.1 T9SS type A sorting domain-containing protein [Flavobacteriales bacterium]
MKRTWISGLIVLFSLLQFNAFAQTSIKVLSYNVLNYPQGEIPNREDTLALILDYVQPDLFLIQELKSEAGYNTIYNSCFSDLQDPFAQVTYVPQNSNPGSSWPLQQSLIYNERLFGLAEEGIRTSPIRDMNRYKLYLKDEAHLLGDTTFLYVFVAHLKSSQGSENEQLRLEMMEAFTAYFNTLPADALAIFGGDFNLYSSDEPAYQLLLSPNNLLQWQDPINAPGVWSNGNYPFKQILTQSTRSSSIFGDGAGGGMDDRFDFIMATDALMNAISPIHYSLNSYFALGNNGTCYNQSIINCDEDNDVPMYILNALYHMSDHLPVVMELQTDLALNSSDITQKKENKIIGSTLQYREARFNLVCEKSSLVELAVIDASGRFVYENEQLVNAPRSSISLPEMNPGVYHLRVKMNEGSMITKTFIIQ